MEIWLIFIFMLIWMPMSALCVIAGIMIGRGRHKSVEPTLSADDKRRAEREKRELDNFWSYTGDEQPR